MMELRVPVRSMSDLANLNRLISSHTLYIRHSYSLLISRTYLSRRQLWLNYSIHTCQWSLYIFYLPIYTRRTRLILWIISISRDMKYRNYSSTYSHSHSIHRIRITLRTNILLRSNRYY
uniref:Uncharacterized protein n=1 Tax=Ailuropoda melanoleuca TaxID=9646 RepID=A0A7N5KPC1_AILME